jgi:hypothetical protein
MMLIVERTDRSAGGAGDPSGKLSKLGLSLEPATGVERASSR